jgi:pyridoxine/pyridoxamine 5'-phosphate oxidase
MLDTQIVPTKTNTLDKVNIRLIARDMSAKIVTTKNEDAQALLIFFAWFFIDAKLGVSNPNASLVFAVEPTTEPTLLTILIKAG